MNSFQSVLAGLNSIAPALFQASVAAGCLALLVIAVRWLGRGAIPVRWLYGLGLLAMARLARPIVPESSLGFRWPAAGHSVRDTLELPSRPIEPAPNPVLPRLRQTTPGLSKAAAPVTTGTSVRMAVSV